MDKYAELRAALESATPGPWEFINHNNEPEESTPSDDWEIVSKVTDQTVCSEPQCHFVSLPAVCDGPYIAAANPHTISALLAERDEYARILDGLPQDAIDGGWTAKGISSYAKTLEAERDALEDALMAIEGLYEYDMPVGEAAMALYEASNIARAALAQEQGEKHDNQD